jgi:DEAD/DEAH box helicase domain-containing protein
VKDQLGEKSIQGYRGGYLPTQRRAIEKGLRNGEIYGVISTNALELGVDIGQLQVCIMTGYPGTIASAWQQAGRAGRRQGEAVIVMVASSNPLDQYVIQHPEFFLKSNPESARINPNNLVILVDHIKCAAYELPFKQGDTFDGVELEDILDYLTEERVLHKNGGKWHWMNDAFPAHNISLRSASQENVIIVDQSSEPANKVIGEMDRFSSMTLLHDEAIYLHQGVQYQVEKLDWEEKKAFVREVNVDYFTDANLAVSLDVLEVDKQAEYTAGTISFGDVSVRAMATIFKKIKFETHENIGSGPIYLPEEELQTSATWITLEEGITAKLKGDGLEKSLLGIAHALKHVAPLLLMCEPMDVQVVPQVKSTHDEKPVVYFYDRYPGGVGLSEKAYDQINELLHKSRELIRGCPCRSGCPSCIGADYPDEDSKELALALLQKLV